MNWSYSSLSYYEACPHAWMYKRIVKLPEKPSWALTNGNVVHKHAEEFLLGSTDKLHPSLSHFDKEFSNLVECGAIPEEAITLDNKWQLIPDGWESKDAWLRLKIDARVIKPQLLIDFKTGRIYDKHIEQGRLYANVHMMLNTEVESVDVEFWYLNSGDVVDYTFYRKDLSDDIADWERRVAVMHNDTAFEPTPHQWCKNCFVKHLCGAYK